MSPVVEEIRLSLPHLELAAHIFGPEDGLPVFALHGCTMEDIEVLFRSHSDKIVAEPMDNGEFDRMIRFEEGEDKYYYCFKDEGCHIIYHRFLPEDYADFDFKPDKKIRNRGNTNENRNI